MVRSSASGTWWERNVPSAGSPSTTFGPVQPFGVRSTIIGQRGRVWPPSSRARRWIAAISSSTSSSVAAISWCIVAGSSPSTKRGA